MKTILLIEDTIEILENLKEYLELKGFKILTASNGQKGIDVANDEIPDLIICDVLMQEMDGYEVLRMISGSLLTYKIPFIFSTSISEKINRTESLRLGADDYLIKPFDMDTLLKQVNKCIDSGSSREFSIVYNA